MFGAQADTQTPAQEEAESNWSILIGAVMGSSVLMLVPRQSLARRLRFLREQGKHDVARELLVYKSSCAGK